jgi:tagaturonate reductase
VLSFAQADKGVVIADDINLFRELKLRLLNATHTLSCGVAFLSGLDTVKNAMDDLQMHNFISSLMQTEIAAAIPYDITAAQANNFASNVLDRFRNPYIEHQWLSITTQYTSKMRSRAIPVLLHYFTLYNSIPENMVTSFAAYILFMKAVKEEKGKYFGKLNCDHYPVQDDKAGYFYEKWQNTKSSSMANSVLRDITLWGHDLTALNGFANAVQEKINEIEELGMTTVLDQLQSKKNIA